MTDRKRAYLRAYIADLPESIREKYRRAGMESYRIRRVRYFAAGLTCKGRPRKQTYRNLHGQSTADPTAYHREYMRTWRAAKRISASQQTYPTAGTSAPSSGGVEG